MAISAAVFKGYERVGPTSYRVRVMLTDVTKNPTTSERWLNASGTTLNELTVSVSRQIADLIAADSQVDLLAGIAVDTAIPITVAGPTQGQIDDAAWRANVQLLVRVKAAQNAGMSAAQLTTDVASLTSTVNTGYTTARGLTL